MRRHAISSVRPHRAKRRDGVVRWCRDRFVHPGVGVLSMLIALALGSCTTPTSSDNNQNTNGNGDTGNCPPPVEISQNITGDTTWPDVASDPSCVDYLVHVNIVDDQYNLNIDAGVVMEFDAHTGLRINGDALLYANGDPDRPIVLTGASKTRGSWYGVTFVDSDHYSLNALRYVTIEYAGEDDNSPGHISAGLRLAESAGHSAATIQYSTVRQSSGYGVYVSRTSRIGTAGSLEFMGNTLTENKLGPAYVFASSLPGMDVSGSNPPSAFTGNDFDEIDVEPDKALGVLHGDLPYVAATWQNLGVPYHILQVADHDAFQVGDGDMTLGPGVFLKFDPDMALIVNGTGSLHAAGTEGASVYFTAEAGAPERGAWAGVAFEDTENAKNSLEYTTIEYGGSRRIGISSDQPADLTITENSSTVTQAKLSHVTLRESAGYGLYQRFGTSMPTFTGNAFTSNALGPARVDISVAHMLEGSDGSSYTGNDDDRVALNVEQIITQDRTWHDLGVPYHLLEAANAEGFRVEGAKLTLDPGVQVQFDPGMALMVRATTDGIKSNLVAEGTPQKPIVLQAASDPWKGIDFNDADGSFANATINGAGSKQFSGVQTAGAVAITTVLAGPPDSYVVFGASSTTDVNYGIVFGLGDTYSDCGLGQVYIPPPDTPSDHCRPPG